VVNEAAEAAGRQIDPEHFGVLVPYATEALPEGVLELFAARFPDADPAEVFPVGHQALIDALGAFVAVGASKFVVVPAAEPTDWTAELEALAATVLPLQT